MIQKPTREAVVMTPQFIREVKESAARYGIEGFVIFHLHANGDMIGSTVNLLPQAKALAMTHLMSEVISDAAKNRTSI